MTGYSLSFAAGACQDARVEFAEAVDAHLAAISRRDLDGYLATVHDDVTLITPMGGLLAGRADVERFHRDWFGDPDWSWEVSPLRSVVAGETRGDHAKRTGSP